jgi:hypothetical protein
MADRPTDDTQPNTRIAVCTILSARTKEGMVEFTINDTTAQMDLDKAREVHRMLGQAIEAAMTDQMLVAFLEQKVGLPIDAAGDGAARLPRNAPGHHRDRVSAMSARPNAIRHPTPAGYLLDPASGEPQGTLQSCAPPYGTPPFTPASELRMTALWREDTVLPCHWRYHDR